MPEPILRVETYSGFKADERPLRIPNLKKEDFQLADNRKLQVISTLR